MRNLLSALLFLGASVAFAPIALAQLETGTLVIESGDSAHTFQIEIADDQEEVRTGLMHRESMDENAGMLFVFSPPRESSMWMKNTLISLDILFMDTDGEVIFIARDMVPGSLRSVGPGVPVKGALEINGGLAEKLGIEPGDVVKHEVFNNIEN